MKSSSESLLDAVSQSGAHDAAHLLEQASGEEAAEVLQQLNPMVAQQVLGEMQDKERTAALTFVPLQKARQWASNREHPEDSVGWLMEAPVAVFRPDATARDTIEEVRDLAKKAFITYGYITDETGRLLGLLSVAIGVGPIGFLMIGWLADHIGAENTLIMQPLIGILAMALIWRTWKTLLHPPRHALG